MQNVVFQYLAALVLIHPQMVTSGAMEIFDMEAIRDPETLEIEVHQDWHVIKGPVPTRQKRV
jgi:hypothetical protein